MGLFIIIHSILWFYWTAFVVGGLGWLAGYTLDYFQSMLPFIAFTSHLQMLPISIMLFLAAKAIQLIYEIANEK